MVRRSTEQTIFDLFFLCTLVLLILAAQPDGALPIVWRNCYSCSEVSSFFTDSVEGLVYVGRNLLQAFQIVLQLFGGITGFR